VSASGERSSERRDRTDQLFAELVVLHADAPARERVRAELADLNLPLVRHLAGRFASWSFALEDAVQIGSVGLVKAIDSFEPARGHAFSAYAVPKIVGEIRRYLRDSHRMVRVPRRTHELQSAVVEAREALTQELGRLPAISEIAERIGAEPDEVVEVVESFRVRETRSLDAGAGPDRSMVDPELVAALAYEERGFATSEWLLDLREALADLSDQERLILSRRFGAELSQSEIAAEIGVSQMQVSRLLRRSLDQLRALTDAPSQAR
jgi:RNA polymerase sigma-B factor